MITEVIQLIERRLGASAEIRFLGDFARGNFIAHPVDAVDWLRIAELVGRYSDMPLGAIDASVIAAAERLEIERVATLDRRHFSVVRPTHTESFVLLP